ncbi:hypothetical protein [Ferruginibacter sp.]
MKRYILSAAIIIVAAITFNSCAPSYVAVRPAPPVAVVRPPAPAPGYIWVSGNYVWRGGRYVYTNGYWSAPRGRRYWVDGHWQGRRGGYTWVPGHWAR